MSEPVTGVPDIRSTSKEETRSAISGRTGAGGPDDELETLSRRFASHVPGLLGAQREYAVLCPLVERPDGLSLLFEVRAAGIRQGGEVCFPGGMREAGETPVQCALRETEEELSISPGEVSVIGTPDFLYNQRGFLVRPILGLVSAAGFSALHPAPAEVADAFTAPLSFFRETEPEVYVYDLTPQPPEGFPWDRVGVRSDYPWAAGRTEVPVWYWKNRAIWGMTARLVRGLVQAME